MDVKLKKSFEKARYVKNNNKLKKYVLRGHTDARYHDGILSIKKKFYTYTIRKEFFIILFKSRNYARAKKT